MKASALLAAIAANFLFILPANAGGGGAGAPLSYLAPHADYGCYGRCLVREIDMHRPPSAHRGPPHHFEHTWATSWQ